LYLFVLVEDKAEALRGPSCGGWVFVVVTELALRERIEPPALAYAHVQRIRKRGKKG